jgi:uncharacterized protein YjbI with pentapeptide repeats
MADKRLLSMLAAGREEWNASRPQGTFRYRLDLSYAQLQGRDLNGYDLEDTLLIGANFQEASLSNVSFWSANAEKANFERAHVHESRFAWTQLRGANFAHASLAMTLFYGAELADIDFLETWFDCTVFANLDLSRCHGLDYLLQRGFTIGMDTFFLSGGLPDNVLRNANVPEDFIAYASSFFGKAIEYYSCFISYSSHDAEFAERLYRSLHAQGVSTWYAPEDLRTGAETLDAVFESINIHDKLVVILSQHSIESPWVKREVKHALEREEREKREILFPITLDDAFLNTSVAWASEIRTRNVGDFRGWELDNTFDKGVERLVRDLKKATSIIVP